MLQKKMGEKCRRDKAKKYIAILQKVIHDAGFTIQDTG